MDPQLSPLGRFERILLATDGSSCSTDAERIALTLAENTGALLRLTTVIVTNPIAETVALEQIETAERDGQELLERLYRESQQRGIRAEMDLRRGLDPLQEIVDAAEAWHADVIIMGRHDTRGWWRRMMGPTTIRAVGAARCSVLVVPEGASMWAKRIILATDGSRFSDAAGVAASKLAAICKLPVTVVSTVRASFSAERAAEAEAAAVRMNEHLSAEGLEVDHVVLQGNPDALILSTAQERGGDVIVIGTHGRTGIERLLVGSVAESVINASTLPVLAVKL